MSTGLETALEGIQPESSGAEEPPEALGSTAPDTLPPAEGSGGGKQPGEENVGDGAPDQTGGEPEAKTQEQILEELRVAAEPQAGDNQTIRQLRSLLKERVDQYESEAPGQGEEALSETDREGLEMVRDLYGYDVEKDQPTTAGFINKLAAKDHNLVGQLLADAITVQIPGSEIQNWTYGHELLQNMGLDPMKFPDLVRFSRGEIDGSAFGITEVPEYVPHEYHEAYKQLNPVNRTDVDIYLRGDDQAQKAAGLQLLQDKNKLLEVDRMAQQREQQDRATFTSQVMEAVDTQVETTLDTLLSTVETNKAFVDVKVHADPNMDALVKNTIINQIAAVANADPVISKRALNSFKQLGVEVNEGQVGALMKAIRDNTEIAVRAERKAKANGQTSSAQAEEAKARVVTAVGKAVGLANRVASEALKKYSPANVVKGDREGNEPNLGGGNRGGQREEARPSGVMSPAELDQLILNTSQNMREA